MEEDVWEQQQKPAALPAATTPTVTVEPQQQMAIARMQAQVGAIRQKMPTVERLVPHVPAPRHDVLALAIPCGALVAAVILGVGSMLVGSQPRQYDAAVIAQLSESNDRLLENSKILAQSRPTVLCLFAVNCPDGGSEPRIATPDPNTAPMPLVSTGATEAIAPPAPDEFTQWLSFFSQQPQPTLEQYRSYLEQSNLQGTVQYQALMTVLGQVPQAIAPAPMPIIN